MVGPRRSTGTPLAGSQVRRRPVAQLPLSCHRPACSHLNLPAPVVHIPGVQDSGVQRTQTRRGNDGATLLSIPPAPPRQSGGRKSPEVTLPSLLLPGVLPYCLLRGWDGLPYDYSL